LAKRPIESAVEGVGYMCRHGNRCSHRRDRADRTGWGIGPLSAHPGSSSEPPVTPARAHGRDDGNLIGLLHAALPLARLPCLPKQVNLAVH
jgi:hypothetical protein